MNPAGGDGYRVSEDVTWWIAPTGISFSGLYRDLHPSLLRPPGIVDHGHHGRGGAYDGRGAVQAPRGVEIQAHWQAAILGAPAQRRVSPSAASWASKASPSVAVSEVVVMTGPGKAPLRRSMLKRTRSASTTV